MEVNTLVKDIIEEKYEGSIGKVVESIAFKEAENILLKKYQIYSQKIDVNDKILKPVILALATCIKNYLNYHESEMLELRTKGQFKRYIETVKSLK